MCNEGTLFYVTKDRIYYYDTFIMEYVVMIIYFNYLIKTYGLTPINISAKCLSISRILN